MTAKTATLIRKSQALPTLVKDKSPIGFFDLWFGLLIGAFFITTILVDISVIDFDQPTFAAQYFIWKANAPYMRVIVTCITLTVPLALIGGLIGVVMTFFQKASTTRHTCDFLGFGALLAVIANAIPLQSIEEVVLAASLKGDIDLVLENLPALRQGFLIALGLNIFMFIVNLVKYGTQAPTPAVVEVAEEPVKAKKD